MFCLLTTFCDVCNVFFRMYWADSQLNQVGQVDLNTNIKSTFFTMKNVRFYGISLFKVCIRFFILD